MYKKVLFFLCSFPLYLCLSAKEFTTQHGFKLNLPAGWVERRGESEEYDYKYDLDPLNNGGALAIIVIKVEDSKRFLEGEIKQMVKTDKRLQKTIYQIESNGPNNLQNFKIKKAAYNTQNYTLSWETEAYIPGKGKLKSLSNTVLTEKGFISLLGVVPSEDFRKYSAFFEKTFDTMTIEEELKYVVRQSDDFLVIGNVDQESLVTTGIIIGFLLLMGFLVVRKMKKSMGGSSTEVGYKSPFQQPVDKPVTELDDNPTMLPSDNAVTEPSDKPTAERFDKGVTNAEILEAIGQQKSKGNKRKLRLKGLALITLSAVLFIGLGVFQWSLEFVVMLAVAILIHELGHLMAMKLYKYKILKMLFLPFIGGVAMGEPDEHNTYKIAMISLFGPLVGILSCFIAVILWAFTRQEAFIHFAYLSLYLNAFNLLPLIPLDGGHFWNETLFDRFPKAAFVFKIFAIIGFALLAYVFRSLVFGIITFVILLTLGRSYKLSKMAKRLRAIEGFPGDTLTEEKIEKIRTEIDREHLYSDKYQKLDRDHKTLIDSVNIIWIKANKIFPKFGKTVFLVALYLVVILLVPFTYGFIYGGTEQSPIQHDGSGMESNPNTE